MADRIRIASNPLTAHWEAEAGAMGISTPMLLLADLKRLREALEAAAPKLTAWEWELLSHVMPDEGVELAKDPRMGERIVSGDSLAASLMEWADGVPDDEVLKAEALARRARTWSDLERWALMVRRRNVNG